MKIFKRKITFSITLFVVGFTLIPEPIDAVPKGYRDFTNLRSQSRRVVRNSREKHSDAPGAEESRDWQYAIHISGPADNSQPCEGSYPDPQSAPEYIKLELAPQEIQSEDSPKVAPSGEAYKTALPADPYAQVKYVAESESAAYPSAVVQREAVPPATQSYPVAPQPGHYADSTYGVNVPSTNYIPRSYKSPRYPFPPYPFPPQFPPLPPYLLPPPLPYRMHPKKSSHRYPRLPPPNFLDFDFNPFILPEYPLPRPPKSYRRRHSYSPCRCNYNPGFFGADESPFGRSYHRRSLSEKDLEVVKSERPIPFPEHALNPPESMYKNYKPYERSVPSADYDEEYDEEPQRVRERLYVVYRADVFDDDDETPSDREIESVVRQAINSARRQHMHGTNPLDGLAYPRYFYDRAEDLETAERPEFYSLEDNELRPEISRSLDHRESKFLASSDSDEATNPGLDQSKWTRIPPATGGRRLNGEKTDIEEFDAAVGVDDVTDDRKIKGDVVVKVVEDVSTVTDDKRVEIKKTGNEGEIGVLADVEQVTGRSNVDTTINSLAKHEETDKKGVDKQMDMLVEMETPVPLVTQSTNFDSFSSTTTDKK